MESLHYLLMKTHTMLNKKIVSDPLFDAYKAVAAKLAYLGL